jgi:hypothetical protein
MKTTIRVWRYAAGGILSLALSVWLAQPAGLRAAADETFEVLKVGAQTYRNVTVTTKSKEYIFILHAEGMSNIKVVDLSPEMRIKLGYVEPEKPKAQTNGPAAWTKQTLARLDTPKVQEMKQQVIQTWNSERAEKAREQVEKLREWSRSQTPAVTFEALGAIFLIYIFFSHCCSLICQKTGNPGGVLVWLPVFKLLPLLRAGGMSRWWFLAFLVPALNLVVAIILWVKIAQACGKSVLVGILMLLPIINVIAFLYLAFSGGPVKKEQFHGSRMTFDPV